VPLSDCASTPDSSPEDPASDRDNDLGELMVRCRLTSDLKLVLLGMTPQGFGIISTHSSLSSLVLLPLRLAPSVTLVPSALLSSSTLRRTSSSSYAALLFIVERRLPKGSADADAAVRGALSLSLGGSLISVVSFATDVFRWDLGWVFSQTGRYREYFCLKLGVLLAIEMQSIFNQIVQRPESRNPTRSASKLKAANWKVGSDSEARNKSS
jgi:hypothetical protein